jgi:adenylate cyclase
LIGADRKSSADSQKAMVGKAACLANDVIFGWSASADENKKQATDLVNRALSRGAADVRAHSVKGSILLFGQPADALAAYNLALEINPNFHTAHAGRAVALILSGRAREAVSPLELALRISPRDPAASLWLWELCVAHLHLRQYEEAIEQCSRSVNMNGANFKAYISLISAYGSTGQMEKARQALAQLDKTHPNFTLQLYRRVAYAFSSDPEYRRGVDDILDGLRKGGIPEQ